MSSAVVLKNIKKILLWVLGISVILAVILLAFISVITKYLIEKYDEKYTGRQITVDWVYVNPLTGYLHLENINIHEFNSDSSFFSAEEINANISMHKLFSSTYEIEKLSIHHPKGNIIQNKTGFNFDDLIQKFSKKTDAPPVHLNILDIKITEGEFYYNDLITPVYYFIKKVTLESNGIRWNSDTINSKFSLESGPGKGNLKGDISINIKNNNYKSKIQANKFDLKFIEQYLQELANQGHFSANLDADMSIRGNFKEADNISIKGHWAINNFHFGKDNEEDYASFDQLVMEIIELNPKNKKYTFDSIMVLHPFFKYERYDYLSNIERMFGEDGANVKAANNSGKFNLILEIADYVRILSKNFFKSNYKINRLAIYNGDVQFNDYALNEKFAMGANPFNFIADSINKKKQRVNASFDAILQPYGNIQMNISMNPNDINDFDFHFKLQKLSIPSLNPYVITYTSYPMDRGTLEFTATWNVKNGNIRSDNHLLLIDPRLAKKLKKEDAKWIPMPLIMAFVREDGNVIDYEIPITGNLNDPKFHLKDVILDLLNNIFVKPPSTPYRMYVKEVENDIDQYHAIQWSMRERELNDDQKKYIEKLADFLKENPKAVLFVTPVQYLEKEKEYLLFFEAKKKYFLAKHKNSRWSTKDSLEVNGLSVKDSLFVHYLDKQYSDSTLYTVQEKCENLIAREIIDAKMKALTITRKAAFIQYFKENGTKGQIAFQPNENSIPYNGFSYFKIKYKGEVPEELIEAYEDLNELNQENSRKKYKKIRKTIEKLQSKSL